ncbi:hypothetical protein AGMMS50293_01080 [Spirochaetia bacterium]|nr:hypothetical protein AGMMS50293_01080 [Spirochaetia bacterium]
MKEWDEPGKRTVAYRIELPYNAQDHHFILFGKDLGLVYNPGNTFSYDYLNTRRIEMELYSVDDEYCKWPVYMKFHFMNNNSFWIECPEWIGQFSVGKNRPWYRLSGPNTK